MKEETKETKETKEFYTHYHDMIRDGRFNSPYILRKYVHRFKYFSIVRFLKEYFKPGYKVLDAGCGDGVILQLIVKSFNGDKIDVFGTDISKPNIQAADQFLNKNNPGQNIPLVVSDGESLPFADESFDIVISCHVLEHLPDFHKGLNEIRRVTRDIAIIALPTCFNLSSIVLLGGDNYWKVGRKTLYAFFLGLARVLANIFKDGIQEGYAGSKDRPHLFRYPWIMKKEVQDAGFEILKFEATSLAIPYIPYLFPPFLRLQKLADRLCCKPFFNNLGFGSTAVVRKIK